MSEPIKIIVFGDSISFGQYVSPHRTWVGRISQRIEDYGADIGRDLLLQCEAVNGRTSRMALETMPQEVQKHSPEILIIQFGLNDCNYWDTDLGVPRVSKMAFNANLQEMLDRAFNCGVQRVLLNTNHPTTRLDPIPTRPSICYQQSNESYNEEIRKVAESYGEADRIMLCDLEKHILELIETTSLTAADFILPAPDLLHLNQQGHNTYRDFLWPRIVSGIDQITSLQK